MNVAVFANRTPVIECPKTRPASGVDFVLIRPGATVLDELECIKGDLDVPLSGNGHRQVAELVDQLKSVPFAAVYASPCTAAVQTAEALAKSAGVRVRIDDDLRNLNHGLWQGKRFEELRSTQPKIYRMWADHPDSVSPPGGETIDSARVRAKSFIRRVQGRHRAAIVAVVTCEPLTTILRSHLRVSPHEDFWSVERRATGWDCVHCET
jgi:probable phosphoglycerate mutase